MTRGARPSGLVFLPVPLTCATARGSRAGGLVRTYVAPGNYVQNSRRLNANASAGEGESTTMYTYLSATLSYGDRHCIAQLDHREVVARSNLLLIYIFFFFFK